MLHIVPMNKVFSDEARRAKAKGKSGGGAKRQTFSDDVNPMDSGGMNASDYAGDKSAQILGVIQDNYSDAMMGTEGLDKNPVDPAAAKYVEGALKAAGHGNLDGVDSYGNLHLVVPNELGSKGRGWGVDSASGKVYDVGSGDHIASLSMDAAKDERLFKKLGKKYKTLTR